MQDIVFTDTEFPGRAKHLGARMVDKSFFWQCKRVFDIVFSLALLPVLVVCAGLLMVFNPFFNRGGLFFVQKRMGKDCVAFNAIKFRTMTCTAKIERSHDDPAETDRITRPGGFLRKSRIDELPQILNVLVGEMSLIGPRPDYFRHACFFLEHVPGYRERHQVRPGISGLAQVTLGYATGLDETIAKSRADLTYVNGAGFMLEAAIFMKTLKTVVGRAGV